MIEEERDINLENLFRNKLEENEMVTHAGLTDRVMRRLERKEFLRVNPARFNIFYAAAVAAALTVAGVLFFSSPESEEQISPAVEKIQMNNDSITQEIIDNRGNEQDQSVDPLLKEIKSSDTSPSAVPSATVKRVDELVKPNERSKGQTVVKDIGRTETTVVEPAGPRAVIAASVSSGCVPLTVSFRNSAGGEYKTEWSFGDGGSSDEKEADYIYDLPGTFNVTLAVTDERGRKNSAVTTVHVWPAPKAEFEIRKTQLPGAEDKVIFTNLSTGAVRYLWSFGDGATSTDTDPEHTYKSYGRYDVRLTAFSEYGCADSVTITDAFTDKGMFLRFPNAFMPNAEGPTGGYYNRRTDEDNQVFHPVASGIASFNLKIYNKTGLLVFESNDIEIGWDGYYKGQICSPGVYVWKVRGTYRNGQSIVMAGDVTLINY